jgi:hypothetical protein
MRPANIPKKGGGGKEDIRKVGMRPCRHRRNVSGMNKSTPTALMGGAMPIGGGEPLALDPGRREEARDLFNPWAEDVGEWGRSPKKGWIMVAGSGGLSGEIDGD